MDRHAGRANVTEWAPPPALEGAGRVAEARHAMEALSPREREILILWDAGMDYHEIGARTSQPVDVVGVVLSRARNRLMMAYDLLDV